MAKRDDINLSIGVDLANLTREINQAKERVGRFARTVDADFSKVRGPVGKSDAADIAALKKEIKGLSTEGAEYLDKLNKSSQRYKELKLLMAELSKEGKFLTAQGREELGNIRRRFAALKEQKQVVKQTASVIAQAAATEARSAARRKRELTRQRSLNATISLAAREGEQALIASLVKRFGISKKVAEQTVKDLGIRKQFADELRKETKELVKGKVVVGEQGKELRNRIRDLGVELGISRELTEGLKDNVQRERVRDALLKKIEKTKERIAAKEKGTGKHLSDLDKSARKSQRATAAEEKKRQKSIESLRPRDRAKFDSLKTEEKRDALLAKEEARLKRINEGKQRGLKIRREQNAEQRAAIKLDATSLRNQNRLDESNQNKLRKAEARRTRIQAAAAKVRDKRDFDKDTKRALGGDADLSNRLTRKQASNIQGLNKITIEQTRGFKNLTRANREYAVEVFKNIKALTLKSIAERDDIRNQREKIRSLRDIGKAYINSNRSLFEATKALKASFNAGKQRVKLWIQESRVSKLAELDIKEYAKSLVRGTRAFERSQQALSGANLKNDFFSKIIKRIKQVGNERTGPLGRLNKTINLVLGGRRRNRLAQELQGLAGQLNRTSGLMSKAGGVFRRAFGSRSLRSMKGLSKGTDGANSLFGKLIKTMTGVNIKFRQFFGRIVIINAVWKTWNSVLRIGRELLTQIVGFDQQLKNIQAITVATAIEIERVGQALLALSIRTPFAPDELAKSFTLLGQAGFTATEGLNAIQAVAAVSIGTLASTDDSVKLLTSAMRAFNRDASEAGDIANILVAAVNNSKLTIEGLNTAFNFAGPAAAAAGLSFAEASAALGTMANQGIRFSTQGTGLRQVLASLISPTDSFRSELASLGVDMNKINPLTNSFGDILLHLNDTVADVTTAFNGLEKRTAGAFVALVSGARNFETLEQQLQNTRSATLAMHTQMTGLQKVFERLKQRLLSLFNTPGMRRFFSRIGSFAEGLIDTLEILLIKLGDKTGGINHVTNKLIKTFGFILTPIKLVGRAVANLTGWLGRYQTAVLVAAGATLLFAAGLATGGMGAAVLGLIARLTGLSFIFTALGSAASKSTQIMKDEFDKLVETSQKLPDSLEDAADSFKDFNEALDIEKIHDKQVALAGLHAEFEKIANQAQTKEDDTFGNRTDRQFGLLKEGAFGTDPPLLPLTRFLNKFNDFKASVEEAIVSGDFKEVKEQINFLPADSHFRKLIDDIADGTEEMNILGNATTHVQVLLARTQSIYRGLNNENQNIIADSASLLGRQKEINGAVEQHRSIQEDIAKLRKQKDEATDPKVLSRIEVQLTARHSAELEAREKILSLTKDAASAIALTFTTPSSFRNIRQELVDGEITINNYEDAFKAVNTEISRVTDSGSAGLRGFREELLTMIGELEDIRNIFPDIGDSISPFIDELKSRVLDVESVLISFRERAEANSVEVKKTVDSIFDTLVPEKITKVNFATVFKLSDKESKELIDSYADTIAAIRAQIKSLRESAAGFRDLGDDEQADFLLAVAEEVAQRINVVEEAQKSYNRVLQVTIFEQDKLVKNQLTGLESEVTAANIRHELGLKQLELNLKLNPQDAVQIAADKFKLEVEHAQTIQAFLQRKVDILDGILEIEKLELLTNKTLGEEQRTQLQGIIAEHEKTRRVAKAKLDTQKITVDLLNQEYQAVLNLNKAWQGIADTIANDVNQAITDVIFGTKSFSAIGSTIKKSLSKGFKDGFKASLDEKFKFDKIFEGNMLNLGDFASKTLGNIGEAFGLEDFTGDLMNELGIGGGSEPVVTKDTVPAKSLDKLTQIEKHLNPENDSIGDDDVKAGLESIAKAVGKGGGKVPQGTGPLGIQGGMGSSAADLAKLSDFGDLTFSSMGAGGGGAGGAALLGSLGNIFNLGTAGAGIGGMIGSLFGTGGHGALGGTIGGALGGAAMGTMLGASLVSGIAGPIIAGIAGAIGTGAVAVQLMNLVVPGLGIILGSLLGSVIGNFFNKKSAMDLFLEGASGVMTGPLAAAGVEGVNTATHASEGAIKAGLKSRDIDPKDSFAGLTKELAKQTIHADLLSKAIAAYAVVAADSAQKVDKMRAATQLANAQMLALLDSSGNLDQLDVEIFILGMQQSLGTLDNAFEKVNERYEKLKKDNKVTKEAMDLLTAAVEGAAIVFTNQFPAGIDVAAKALRAFANDGKVTVDELAESIDQITGKVGEAAQQLAKAGFDALSGGNFRDAQKAFADEATNFLSTSIKDAFSQALGSLFLQQGLLTPIMDAMFELSIQLQSGAIDFDQFGDSLRHAIGDAIPQLQAMNLAFEEMSRQLTKVTGLPVELLTGIFTDSDTPGLTNLPKNVDLTKSFEAQFANIGNIGGRFADQRDFAQETIGGADIDRDIKDFDERFPQQGELVREQGRKAIGDILIQGTRAFLAQDPRTSWWAINPKPSHDQELKNKVTKGKDSLKTIDQLLDGETVVNRKLGHFNVSGDDNNMDVNVTGSMADGLRFHAGSGRRNSPTITSVTLDRTGSPTTTRFSNIGALQEAEDAMEDFLDAREASIANKAFLEEVFGDREEDAQEEFDAADAEFLEARQAFLDSGGTIQLGVSGNMEAKGGDQAARRRFKAARKARREARAELELARGDILEFLEGKTDEEIRAAVASWTADRKAEIVEAFGELADSVSNVNEFIAVWAQAFDALKFGIFDDDGNLEAAAENFGRITKRAFQAFLDSLPVDIEGVDLTDFINTDGELDVEKVREFAAGIEAAVDVFRKGVSAAIAEALQSGDVGKAVGKFTSSVKKALGDAIIAAITEGIVNQIFIQGLIGPFMVTLNKLLAAGADTNTLLLFAQDRLPELLSEISNLADEVLGPLLELIYDLFSSTGLLDGQNDILAKQNELIQKQLEVAQEWSDIIDNVNDVRRDLIFGDDKGGNVKAAIAAAQEELQTQLGIFRDTSSTAGQRQAAASEVLNLIKQITSLSGEAAEAGLGEFQRESSAFQLLKASFLGILTEVETAAIDGASQLQILQDQLDKLTEIAENTGPGGGTDLGPEDIGPARDLEQMITVLRGLGFDDLADKLEDGITASDALALLQAGFIAFAKQIHEVAVGLIPDGFLPDEEEDDEEEGEPTPESPEYNGPGQDISTPMYVAVVQDLTSENNNSSNMVFGAGQNAGNNSNKSFVVVNDSSTNNLEFAPIINIGDNDDAGLEEIIRSGSIVDEILDQLNREVVSGELGKTIRDLQGRKVK